MPMNSARTAPRTGCLRSKHSLVTVAWLAALLLFSPGMAYAHDAVQHSGEVFDLVGFDQRLDNQVPLQLVFRDQDNRMVKLGDLVQDKPVVLALSYFECETLCPLVRQGLVDSLQPLTFDVGEQFDVILVSIDPDETPADAAAAKQATLADYDRAQSAQGWHFLTGEHDAIDELADAVGFRYAYDGEKEEYAHASGLVLLTPAGTIARYFFGIEYATRDLRFGLVEASQNKIGTPIDQLLLLCYHYEPGVGKYSLLIMNVLRLAAILTVSLLAMLILVMRRKESNQVATLG